MNTSWRFWVPCLSLFLAGAIGRAQEVRVIKLEWKTAEEVGVAEPKLSTLTHKPASSPLSQMKEIFYVETAPTEAPKNSSGKFAFNMRAITNLPGTPLLMQDAARLIITTPADVSLLTAERAERARLFFIYNPGRDSDAAPARLLELHPPFKPEGVHQKWVWVQVTLDRKGKVVAATAEEDTKPELAELAIASVKTWRFSEPWKTDEKGEATLRIPVTFMNRRKSAGSDGKPDKPARPELVKQPDLPSDDSAFGNGLFEVTVDTKGRVSALTLLRSSSPAWAETFADHYLASEYKPVLKDGQPVESTFKEGRGLAMRFTTAPTHSVAVTPESTQISAISGSATSKNYDNPPVVQNLPSLAYPFDLLMQNAEDKVRFTLSIDENGHVAQPPSLESAHAECQLAVRAMIDAYRFQPATLKGKPVATAFKSDVTFGLRDGEVRPSKSAVAILELLKNTPNSVIPAADADQAPQQIVFLKPVMPSAAWCHATTGTAEIEFFIDKKGHAQLPRVVSATDPAFGYAAAQAIAFWRFAPVKKNGDAAIVRTRATLNFPADCGTPVDPDPR